MGRRVAPELARLRLRLTGWYVATFAVVLLVLGGGLFFVISRQIGREMDQSIRSAVGELVRTARAGASHGALAAEVGPDGGVAAVRALRIPDRSLYLFDAEGRLLAPDTASSWVREAAHRAAQRGSASLEANVGNEHQLRVYAERFARTAGPGALVAVAAADIEELEDRYTLLITQFSAAAATALALVAMGGVLLARKSAAPVEAAFEQMRRFMADAAHELRTPVASLRAQGEVALQQPREAAEYVSTIEGMTREAEHLGAVVDDLLVLARGEANERPVERAPLFLDDMVTDAVGAARALAERRGVRLALTSFEETPVVGDATLLRRLLMILLDNAIKYTPAGGHVRVGVTAERNCAVVVVEDTGTGIPAEALPHIFDRFFRADSARARGGDAGGAGLGLSIARWIAEAHRAEIAVESTLGRGTTVRLTMPLDRGRQPE